ncbi:UrcA family protein [Sphingomonas sp.]|uniref:UrcA family protein n=1 Tax=Sphingomonas sp. TaxID=28214 RepID=UPI000DB06241|nr:UrcA family protein [Sphingomonas sp.]PZU11563.1 MAG: hypothetical protein DI605_00790 [Sphingomonas sp.]
MSIKKSFGSAFTKGALSVAATCLLAGGAFAQSVIIADAPAASKITMQKQVRYNDLDLSTSHGRAKLNERVRFAASDVCDGRNVSNTRSPVDYLNCYSIAMRDANRQLSQRFAAVQGSTVSAVR